MGNPRCLVCHGRGGYIGPYGRWRKCQCMKITKEALAWQQYMNGIGTENPPPKPEPRSNQRRLFNNDN